MADGLLHDPLTGDGLRFPGADADADSKFSNNAGPLPTGGCHWVSGPWCQENQGTVHVI